MPKMLIATDKEEKKSEQCNVNVAKVLQGVSLMLQNIKKINTKIDISRAMKS